MKEKFNCKWCNKETIDYLCRKRFFCSRTCQVKSANTGIKRSKIWDNLDLFIKEYNLGKTFREIGEKYNEKGGNIQGLFKKADIKVRRMGIREGKTPWNKGKILPEMSGENSSNWRGGTSFEPYPLDWTETLKKSIRERDKYLCQICSEDGNMVHHIDYDKKNCNPDNLVTLCNSCHSKTNSKRNYWIFYFQQKKGR